MARVKVTINWGELRSMTSAGGPIGRGIINAGETTAARARAAVTASGRVRTGAMRAGIRRGRFSVRGFSPTTEVVGSTGYTIFQDQGTRYITGARFFETALSQLSSGDVRA